MVNDMEMGLDRAAHSNEIMIRSLNSLPETVVWYLQAGWFPSDEPPYYLGKELPIIEKLIHYYDIPFTTLFYSMFNYGNFNELTQKKQVHNFAVDEIHPDFRYHLLLAYFIVQQFGYTLQLYKENHEIYLHSYILPPPITFSDKLSTELLEFYERDYILLCDLWTAEFYKACKEAITVQAGFSFINDRDTKYGLIGNEEHSFVQFKMWIETTLLVYYLKTYENIGYAAMWFGTKDEIKEAQETCQNLDLPKANENNYVIFDGYHERFASMNVIDIINVNTP
eukprot:UN03863